jgi:hypothetical protein
MEDLIAAVGEVAAADAAFTQWIEGEDSEPKDADAVGKRLRVALDTLIARWRECEASEHKHVEMAATLRVVRASIAMREADEFHHALAATQFPDEEVAAAANRSAEAYDAWITALDAMKERQ